MQRSGYTLRENETNNSTAERFASEDTVITSGSTTAARLTIPSNDWAAAIATFKPATTTSGGGGGSSTSSTTIRYIAADNIYGSNLVMDASSTYMTQHPPAT